MLSVREGALPGSFVNVGLAVCQNASHRKERGWTRCKIITICSIGGGTGDDAFVPRGRYGVLPWSPLARGLLANRPEETLRSQTDEYAEKLYGGAAESDQKVIARVNSLAATHGVPPARIAWRGCSTNRGLPPHSRSLQVAPVGRRPGRIADQTNS